MEFFYERLKDYPNKILNKFLDNKNFLTDIDENKSKFQWTRFELKAAIFHFFYFFNFSIKIN